MSQPLATIATLDERWLEFARRTRPVFAAHPQLVPVRQAIFKDLVERGQTLSLTDRAKGWARLALRRQHSQGDFRPVDVVFWMKSAREVATEAILPVQRAVQAMGAAAMLVDASQGHIHVGGITPRPIAFQVAYTRQPLKPWRQAWDALRACLPHDLGPEHEAAFISMGQMSDNCVAEARYVLERLRPRLLVVPVDQLLSESAACVAARQLGIASLVLLHGAVSPYNAPLTADRMAVWGRVSQQQMAALAVPSADLAILGSPRHDHFPAPTAPDVRARFRQALNLPDLPLLVFFSNGNDPRRNSHEAVAGCAAWLEQAAAQLAGSMSFVVRLHPNEDGRFYHDCQHLRVFKHECDLATTLAAADVCGALCSTALVDALLYGRPVLQFYADSWPDLADNWRRGLAQRVAGSDELVATLRHGLASGWDTLAAPQTAQIKSVFANHGCATETVAQYITEQVQV